MINFDDIDDWVPSLDAALASIVPEQIRAVLVQAQPEYVEDALDLLFQMADRDALIDATLEWIRLSEVASYHGSRLAPDDVASIRAHGLIPLRADARRFRLTRALSPHPRWLQVAPELDRALTAYGEGCRGGCREDQVHLTLSRAGLTLGFNHYLTHGAEFDQRVAEELLGSEGEVLLRNDGVPTLVTVSVPGSAALAAAHPHFSIEDVRSNGSVPNLAREFLSAWSYRIAYPGFQAASLEVDCGMVFRAVVPAGWIVGVDTVVV